MKELYLKVAKALPSDFGRGIARIDPNTLLELKLSPGDIIEIEGKRATVAKVWRAEKQDWGQEMIRIDGFTRQNADVGIGERVKVKKASVKDATHIVLAPPEGTAIQFSGNAVEMIKHQLLKRPVMLGDVVPLMSSMPNPFMGRTLSNQAIPLIAVKVEPAGAVIIGENTEIELRDKPVRGYEQVKTTGITYEDIGGLKDEVQRVREMIELPMKHPELFQQLGIEPPKGVLLHGPPGTGKTLLAKAVANECGAEFFSIAGPEIMSKYYGESEQRLREIFENARENAPSIIFIDELDSIAPRREEVTGEVERRVVAQLLTMMDGLEERGQVVVIGATNRVDAVDPALRRGGRFDREIEIGVPDAHDRLEILQIHTRGMPLDNVNLEKLASITHGFVGADLAGLAKEAAMKALRRYLPNIDLDKEIPREFLEQMRVTNADFFDALKDVQPSAMREIFIEPTQTRWSDVGGLEEAKQEIIETIEWPLKNPRKFADMGIKPPKGIVLYGPPGTGKTLLAKAVANESEANFISIRGPELLSKWVGESEKAVRETFRKARQVAPAIIFFDELDALTPARAAGEGGMQNVERSVVNQLLTELDGLVELEGVVVIGATNRPDIIDPALMRPGRFDRLVYVGPPSAEGRVSIFKIHTRYSELEDKLGRMLKGLNVTLDKKAHVVELFDLLKPYTNLQVKAICGVAAEMASKEQDSGQVTLKHFKEAIKKVKADPELLSKVKPDGTPEEAQPFYQGVMPLSIDVDFHELADLTENYVGSDIEAICREAAMLALRENFETRMVEMRHFREALKKVKPTMNDMVKSYYQGIRDHFKGGISKDIQKVYTTDQYV
ncbi:CDC48 family AAA ATPase [Methanocella conradii]|uniref:CDC48 family AAA ATPase n=1 Tax=Methanocella conradii TaxID=1175444 RepID=UPI00157DE179|nr:CDC48 family AAA ATPase [Methanocella conradii]